MTPILDGVSGTNDFEWACPKHRSTFSCCVNALRKTENAQKRKNRLVKNAKKLKDEDLLEIYAMRQRAAATEQAADAR